MAFKFNPITGKLDLVNTASGGGAVSSVNGQTGTVVLGASDVAAEPANINIQSHIANTSNPHSVTKSQVGLPNADNTSDANKPVSTAQQTALDLKANLASPALTGIPTAPTASAATNNTQLATTAFVATLIANLINSAPGALDTLGELAAQLASDESAVSALTTTVAGKLAKASNLSDLTNAATARTNLGLGSLATQNGTFSGTSSGTNTGDQNLTPYFNKTSNTTDDITQGSANLFYTDARVAAYLAMANLYLDLVNHRLGIGTSTPISIFHLKTASYTTGIIETTSLTTGSNFAFYTGTHKYTIGIRDDYTVGSFTIRDDTSNVERFSISTLGNVIIPVLASGATAPTPSGTTKMVVTDSNGQLSFAAIPISFTWNEVTGTTQTAVINNGYIANNAAQVVITLPTTAAVGSTLKVTGKGAGGWKIAQGASQIIKFTSGGVAGVNQTTTGTSGFVASNDSEDSIELVCTTADTTWKMISKQGNLIID